VTDAAIGRSVCLSTRLFALLTPPSVWVKDICARATGRAANQPRLVEFILHDTPNRIANELVDMGHFDGNRLVHNIPGGLLTSSFGRKSSSPADELVG
jgi:hypothetical protein